MEFSESVCNDACPCGETVTMHARILRVSCCELLVCDLCTCQEVLVHTDKACCFCVGQQVCIEYSGIKSISCGGGCCC